ncbi:hypothetical protein J2Z21_009825 [Streptomyces griseochromogenes]|uniref:Uncharacterized protein n=1 Tax=Streptomyces griseochromogenes TaxID=68214 RepID=A0ABS4MBR4_9ACTN|nr:hypothetical protein [Streptomyces griseochromogenes]
MPPAEPRGWALNAGSPPEPGTSHLTIRTYRVGPGGERTARSRLRTFRATPDPERVADSLAWPPCGCPRCRTSTAH